MKNIDKIISLAKQLSSPSLPPNDSEATDDELKAELGIIASQLSQQDKNRLIDIMQIITLYVV